MGIDALMFVRIKGRDNWLTETETVALSHKAGQCFGADNFFIVHQEEKWSGARHAIEIVKPWKSEDNYGESQRSMAKSSTSRTAIQSSLTRMSNSSTSASAPGTTAWGTSAGTSRFSSCWPSGWRCRSQAERSGTAETPAGSSPSTSTLRVAASFWPTFSGSATPHTRAGSGWA